MKRTRLWYDVNPWILRSIVRIQSLWRGHSVRIRMELAGPGVLKRESCHNEDELTTCVPKTRQNPLDYFGLLENGTLYWFDQRTILQWTHTNQYVLNPYTRQPLSIDSLRRLRELSHKRSCSKVPLYHSQSVIPRTLPERRDMRWLRVCQILQENGIKSIRFEHFASMTEDHIEGFLNFLREDIRWWVSQSQGRRRKYYMWIATFRLWSYRDDTQMNCDLAGILLAILMDLKQNTSVAEMIRNAYERSSLINLVY
jgi:hypothetical protein